jgi:hypothetical protein
MEWFSVHHAMVGILADTLTFAGGCILTRDAFLRLQDLKRNRIDKRFRADFPSLNLSDDEWRAAVMALRWTLAGFGLMVLGFLLQLGLRFLEV